MSNDEFNYMKEFVRQTPEMVEPTAIFKFLVIHKALKVQSELILISCISNSSTKEDRTHLSFNMICLFLI